MALAWPWHGPGIALGHGPGIALAWPWRAGGIALSPGILVAREVRDAAILGEACGAPKPDWILHPELVLEGPQRRCGVEHPITPSKSMPMMRPFAMSALDFRASRPEAVSTSKSGRGAGGLVLGELAEGPVGNNLRPACGGHLEDRC